ncbi:helix-turn-helix transcriptional regulator [Mucilaginibacter koreensis]
MKKITINYTEAEFRQMLREELQLILGQTGTPAVNSEADNYINTQQAANYLGFSMSKLYKLIHKKEIPFDKREGLRTPVLFKKSILDNWIKEHNIKQ